MHRIEGDGFEQVDVGGGVLHNRFTGGDPLIPIPATRMTSKWANAVQEELAQTIEGLGGTLNTEDTDTYGQLLGRLNAKFGRLDLVNSWAALNTFDAGLTVSAGTATFAGGASVTAGTFSVGAISSTFAGPATLNGETRVNAKLGLNVAPLFPLHIADTGNVGNALVRVGSGGLPLMLLTNGGFNYVGLGFNTYFNSSDTRVVTGFCSDFAQASDGVVKLRTGGTGSAGTTPTMVEKLRVPQSAAATATTASAALELPNGHLSLDGTVAPNSNVALKNTITPSNIVKAWARILTTGGGSTGATIVDGFNVSGATVSSSNITVTLAQAMANTNYAVFAVSSIGTLTCGGAFVTTSTLLIQGRDISGSTVPFPAYDFQASGARTVQVLVLGAQ